MKMTLKRISNYIILLTIFCIASCQYSQSSVNFSFDNTQLNRALADTSWCPSALDMKNGMNVIFPSPPDSLAYRHMDSIDKQLEHYSQVFPNYIFKGDSIINVVMGFLDDDNYLDAALIVENHSKRYLIILLGKSNNRLQQVWRSEQTLLPIDTNIFWHTMHGLQIEQKHLVIVYRHGFRFQSTQATHFVFHLSTRQFILAAQKWSIYDDTERKCIITMKDTSDFGIVPLSNFEAIVHTYPCIKSFKESKIFSSK